MGTKYSSNSASGYNSTPPADNGSTSESNKVKWSTIKDKLADPLKDLADTINSELATHFDNGPNSYSTNQTLDSTHYNQVNEVYGSGVTITLTDAATLGAGWFTDIVSTDTANGITLARATGSDTINGVAANSYILPMQHHRVTVNNAANGFLVSKSYARFYKGADVASASALPVLTDGNYFDVTGTTTVTSINSLGVGTVIKLHFDDALTLTHHATDLVLPGGANITTAAGDEFEFTEYASGDWRCTGYALASGKAIATSSSDIQTFTSSGTWTKPAGFPSTARVQVRLWGGGGSGGAASSTEYCGGGGGGSFIERWLGLSTLGATETVTVGSGGAGVTSGSGNAGGNSTFGSYLTAYGGGGGGMHSVGGGGGGGGGLLGAGSTATDSFGAAGGAPVAQVGSFAGGDGGDGSSSGADGNPSIHGGGGGGGGGNSGSGGDGGTSVYAGGGGGGAGSSGNGAGGVALLAGGGGDGANDPNDGGDGTQPGGGGGGISGTGTSGSGGDGLCVVIVFR
jgi:hypothetical protein